MNQPRNRKAGDSSADTLQAVIIVAVVAILLGTILKGCGVNMEWLATEKP